MIIILVLAGTITGVKMYLVEKFGPPPDPGPTFKPVEQMIGDNKKYNGNGYIPCNGFVFYPNHFIDVL